MSPVWVRGFLIVFCVIQATFPARHFFMPGDVLWSEEGMRWSWKVMVREKNGSITYRVKWKGRKRELHVPPRTYLTDHQSREMSGQPDMIVRLAKHIARDYEAKGYEDVEVRVDAIVSLNGRAPKALIDPDVDLARVDELALPAPWILDSPSSEPPRLGREL